MDICEYVGSYSDPDDGPVSLKALRLVSRHFRDPPLEGLFSRVFLYMHPERWAALNNIANTPYLAKHVTRLELSVAPLLEGEDTKQRWQKEPGHCFHGCIRGSDVPKQIRQGVGSTMAKAYNDIKAFPSEESAYARYLAWFSREEMLDWDLRHSRYSRHHDPAPRIESLLQNMPVDLHKLPRLTNVKAIDCHNLSNVRFTYESDNKYCLHSRRELETCVSDKRKPGLNTAHLSFFMLIANHLDFTLQTLEVTEFSELLAHQDCKNEGITILSLRHLFISPQSARKPIANIASDCSRTLARWVTDLPHLETLDVLRYPPVTDRVDVFAMLRTVRWPKLRTVRLQSVATKATNLRHFLLEMYPHKVLPFEEIAIVDPFIVPAEWAQLRHDLQKLDPTPKKLMLTDEYKPPGDAQRWWEEFETAGLRKWPQSRWELEQDESYGEESEVGEPGFSEIDEDEPEDDEPEDE